jgi:dethiobiotin synthetase
VTSPRRLVVVTGTGTEVGKTWVAAATLSALQAQGLRVSARKPAQSFDAGDTETDADVLGAATGEDPRTVCPSHRWYAVPLAPPMAAAALGRPGFTLTDLVEELTWPDDVDLGLVETAGGVRSPLAADDGDAVALAAALMPDALVLVADAGLGTLNAIRLTLDAFADLLASREDLVCHVVLNRFDPALELHRLNLAWLRDHDGIDPVTSPADLATRLYENWASE